MSNPIFPASSSRSRSFTGESLREIAFPLGGIGTGTVSLGGRGDLRDWEIFNRPGKGKDLPYTFFSLWARQGSEPSIARVLERRVLPPYRGGSGIPTARVAGLPRFAEATFRGEYPFAWIDFHDEALPLEVSLTAFNPMVPLDADASGLPIACFRWRLTNRSPEPVEATVAFSLYNAAGYDGQAGLGNRRHPLFGQNLNEFVEGGARAGAHTGAREAGGDGGPGARGLRFSTRKYAPDHLQYGSLALLTSWPEVTYSERWQRAGWWDDLQDFWDDFSENGRLPDRSAPEPSPEGQTDVGSLGLRTTLAPGASAELPFLLAWHFPNLTNTWNRDEGCCGARLGNYYARDFPDAWSLGCDALGKIDDLERRSEAFRKALYGSTLPGQVLDAAGSQMSIIRTTTCLRTEDGRFHAFEGCNDNAGCCPMDCTHVWNYEQALAFLFPELERSMRLTDFGVNTRADGRMAFRTLLPLASERLWGGPPAADGQMGCILKLYREWKLSGDEHFLEALWPHAWAALKYAWQKWDMDRDGVMEGEQHNTYDIEFYGPNTMMGTLYLAALRAAAEMASACGARKMAKECLELAEAGARKHDEQLWNGEYYVQQVIPPAGPGEGLGLGTQSLQDTGELRYQYGPGCLSDQLLGQWFAHVAGLGYVLPREHVRAALQSIVRHNFRADFSDHANCQRIYAVNDEAGLLLCSFPNGGRPRYPFPYADEVWTGIEYQVAAHCLYEGLIDEGLRIVQAVRDRYDGAKRNPWDEVECGHHYARAMSSWSLILALSGFRWDATTGTLAFAPMVNADDFRCFFSTGTGWGTFEQQRQGERYTATIRLLEGELTLRAFTWSAAVALPPAAAAARQSGRLPHSMSVHLDDQPLSPPHASAGRVEFAAPIALAAGQALRMESP